MDQLDKSNLLQTIMLNVYKYDDEGRRANLTAEETVEYAKKLLSFIEEE